MENGANRPPTEEEMQQAMEALQAEVAARGPFDELVELRNFSMTLLRLNDDSWALVMDTPQRRRYAIPMSTKVKDDLNDMLTRSRLEARPGETPPNLRGPKQ